MLGFDDWLVGQHASGAMALLVALLLGLRHATDPDHLTAVSTLVLSDRRQGTRRASHLGLAWGLGHAMTLFLFGLPVILFRRFLPEAVQAGAEIVIGIVIVALAIRLLVRWRRGAFHAHLHEHEGQAHSHPHAHELRAAEDHAAKQAHGHRHAETLGRSPLAALGIGMLHGVGGSAAVGVLLVGAVAGRGEGVLALFLFAAATAVSMALVSSAFGYALARGPLSRLLLRWIPIFGLSGILFGLWYAFDALRGLTGAS